MKAGGLESEQAYPYTSGNGADGQCHFKHNKITANITGWGCVPCMPRSLFATQN